MSKIQDALAIIRSLRMIAESGVKLQQSTLKKIWDNSSLKILARDLLVVEKQLTEKDLKNENLVKNVGNMFEKVTTVLQSLQIYNHKTFVEPIFRGDLMICLPFKVIETPTFFVCVLCLLVHLNIPSVIDDKVKDTSKATKPVDNIPKFQINPKIGEDFYEIKLTSADRELLRKLDMEHERIKQKLVTFQDSPDEDKNNGITSELMNETMKINKAPTKVKTIPNPKSLSVSEFSV